MLRIFLKIQLVSFLSSLVFGVSLVQGQSENCGNNPTNDNRPFQPNIYDKKRDFSLMMTNGAFVQSVVDLKLPGVMPIELTRFYDSTMGYKGFMGHNWDFSLNRRLVLEKWNGDGSGVLYYYRADNCRILIKFYNYNPVIRDLTKITGSGTAIDGVYYTLASGPGIDQLTIVDKFGNKDIFKMLNVPLFGSTLNLSGIEGNLITYMNYLVETQDAQGNHLVYSRDYKNRLIRVEDPEHDRYITFEYNPLGLLVAATDSAGRTMFYRYAWKNDAGIGKGTRLAEPVLVKVIYPVTPQQPLGSCTRYEYDQQGLLTKIIDGNGRLLVANAYRNFFQSVPLTQKNIGEIQEQITSTGTVKLMVKMDGNEREMEFTDAKAGRTRYLSNSMGNILRESRLNNEGKVVFEKTMEYKNYVENIPRKIKEQDTEGNQASWDYDGNGNLIQSIQITPSGTQVVSYGYETGRLNQLKYQKNADGSEITYDYGFRWWNSTIQPQRITKFSAKQGKQIESILYNPDGQIKECHKSDGSVMEYTYSPSSGYLTALTQKKANGETFITRWSYDSAGNVVSETKSDGELISYDYDAANNLVEIRKSNGEVERRFYDAEHNLLSSETKKAVEGK